MISAISPLDAGAIKSALTTRVFGRVAEYYSEIGSTNDLLRERARAGAPEGLLIVADEQKTGRGRLGRVWTAPPAASILASLLLRPRLDPDEAFAPTMILGLAVQQAAIAFGVPATLKWPNDVLVGERKLSGILCEIAFGADSGQAGSGVWIVAGFGVNANVDFSGSDLEARATSFLHELGHPVNRAVLLARILVEAEDRYYRWQGGNYGAIWSEWRSNLATLGRQVRVLDGEGEPIAGQALDVAPDGTLIVGTAAGERRVFSGIVEVLAD